MSADSQPFHATSHRHFFGTTAIVLAVIAGFFVLDMWLAYLERTARADHAADLYTQGMQLLNSGDATDAADRLRDAHAVERDSALYSLALAQAILASGNTKDAEATLEPVLETNANNGALNLAMARVFLREHRVDEATAYYHRAIYGTWSADTMFNRDQARLELIGLLRSEGRRRELLAELLPFEEVSGPAALQARIAGLFVYAGSPQRGITVYQALLRVHPTDSSARAGLALARTSLDSILKLRAAQAR